MHDEPLPDQRRVTRAQVHSAVAIILPVWWVMAYLSGHSQGFGAYEAAEKATAVAIATFAGMCAYFLIRPPTDPHFSMALASIPMGGMLRIGPKVTPESFNDVLAHSLLVDLMVAVVMGWLESYLPRHDAGKATTPSTLRNRRRELELKPVDPGVVRSYLEAGLTDRGREDAP